MNLTMMGIDFVHAPLKERERVSFVRGQVQALLPQLAKMTGVAGCVLLATCNRTELYLHGEDGVSLDPLAMLARAAGFEAAVFRGLSVTRTGDTCVQHLMAVAAGLESQIFGDDQILTQVRDAAALAREAQTMDSVLDTLFRRAVTAGKRVRTEVRLTGVPASAATAGVRRAQDFFGALEGRRAVVIGNGEMGRRAAEALRAQGCAVTVTLRSYHHGETIVPAGCDTFPYDRRCEVLEGADLAISATTSPHFTLTARQVSALWQPPRLLLDLAMPRDIEQAAGEDARVTLYNLDDLGDLDDSHSAAAKQAAARILDEAQAEFYRWHAYRQALPVIAQIKDTALGRLHFDHAYDDLYRDGDMDGLMELAVGKTVDLLLGGMKELVDAGRLEACLAHMRKGSGR